MTDSLYVKTASGPVLLDLGTGGGGSGTVTRQVFTATNITLSAGAEWTVPTYTPGSNLLAVYWNGLLLSKDIDYSESSATGVTFNFDITADDILQAVIFAGTSSTGSGTMTTVVDDSRSAVISAGTSYAVTDHAIGENRLSVFLNGLQYSDFSETSRTSIVFDIDIPADMAIVVTTNNL